jgi:hypothetical protein
MANDEAWQTMKNLIAGTIGGSAGIAAGQPLDTVKVRLQSASPGQYRGAVHCFTQTLQQEGVRALYKGLKSPLIGNGPLNATAFGAQGSSQRFMDKWGWFPQSKEDAAAERPNYAQLWTGGAWAGFLTAFVSCPVELVFFFSLPFLLQAHLLMNGCNVV